MKEIPIFFTIDDSYAQFLGAALNSAIKNSSKDRNYRAIVIYQTLSDEHRSKLKALETDNFAVDFVPMQNKLEMITDSMGNRLRCDYFTLTIYFRIFIPAMFPQYDKGIYIDSDIIVPGDLAEMFDTDIGDNFLGACADKSVVDIPEIVNYMENAIGVSRYKYINSGVLLMNMKKLREAELDRHFLSLFTTYRFDCIAPDQDYLNAMCAGKIHYLDEEWDAMPTEGKEPLKSPKLIHYNLFSKPWCYDGIQYGELFWKYAKDSGFIDELTKYKENYSDDQKRSDSDCLALLIRRADTIPSQEGTFKKIFESGAKIRL